MITVDYFDQLGSAVGELDGAIDGWMRCKGVPYNVFAVLYMLAGSAEGQCTQKSICDEWMIPKQTMHNVCKQLQSNGWIEFAASPRDGREKLIRLTQAGEQVAIPLKRETSAMMERSLKRFGTRNAAELLKLLSGIAAIINEECASMPEAAQRR